MSEAVKKTKPAPSDYGPKTMPAILSMAEDAQMAAENRPYPVKAVSGGRYIDGIPMLKWGEWKDSSYSGCVTALLNATGIPVSYEEVMGLSGVCWQVIMLPDWDPSSQMPQNGKLCEQNVGDALGISVYTPSDEKTAWALAQNSIDRGIPVLLVGGRHAPEWTLACGYTVEKSETRFFGRTYFDVQSNRDDEKVIEGQSTNISKNEIYTQNRYFYLNGFPGWVPSALTRFYDRPGPSISRRQALKVSLETCLSMFEQPSGELHQYGYAAYDVLIKGFELDDEAYRATCG